MGMELCGWYSTLMSVPYREYRDEYIRENHMPLATQVWPPDGWDLSLRHQRDLMELGFVNRAPLTSAKGIQSHVRRSLSENSNSRALVAARLLRDGSHSPMESRLYARYCLPRRHGGLNLNPVELNAKIQLTDEIAEATGKREYSVDLYWPKGNIAIEYEGSFAHSGISAEARDRLKRNILEAKGIRIISIDKAQYANEDMLEFHGVEIAKSMGIKPETLAPNARESRARHALIDAVNSWDTDLYRP
ncbi:MAG: hypothetical protein Q4D27_01350 [Coriobacteriia bacterium]|nr:hypothetical protein [Coriobacteriia bacterium]